MSKEHSVRFSEVASERKIELVESGADQNRHSADDYHRALGNSTPVQLQALIQTIEGESTT